MTYFNDPRMAQAFSGIAKAFAPPKASDIYAYARAQQVRDAVSRARIGYKSLAEHTDPRTLAMANILGPQHMGNLGKTNLALEAARPESTPESRGRFGIGAGIAAANTEPGLVAAHQNTLRQQAMVDAVNREKIRLDNATRVQTNTADNNTSQLVALATPMSPNTVRYVPQAMAAEHGVPPVTRGDARLRPGERLFAARPAASPDAALADEAGGAGDAVLMAEGSAKPVTGGPAYIAVLSDGRKVSAKRGPDGAWHHSQTGERLPNDVVITEAKSALNQFPPGTKSDAFKRIAEAEETLNLTNKVRGLLADNATTGGAPGKIQQIGHDVAATMRALADSMRDIPAGGASAEALAQRAEAAFGSVGSYQKANPQFKLYMQMLAGQVARAIAGKEAGVKSLQLAMSALGTGEMLENRERTMAVLEALDYVTKQRIARYRKLTGGQAGVAPSATPTGTPAASGAPVKRYTFDGANLAPK